MKKVIILCSVIFFIVAFLCVILFFNWAGKDMENDMVKTEKALLAIDFKCQEGAIEKSAPWGKRGYSRFCIENAELNGKWIGWEKEKPCITGNYLHGEKHGVWEWYNDDGTINKKIIYKYGVLVEVKRNGVRP